ncbi:MAG TPA: CaiB/BaiF CoA-transferase family protein [Aliidongia sp.]|nr:CaiB/BaiF CoA-transferase family protein [Aliidongia sp.]
MPGPLAGITIIEMAAIGPVPFAGMVLADFGAEVIKLERAGAGNGAPYPERFDVPGRGKKSVALDLKNPEGVAAARRLIASADAVIEGFRPGVMERLGLGPLICRADNPRLVYGRISGWGSSGPMAAMAGHDLNYLGLSGALAAMGSPGEPPPVPLNLIGDYGGGAMMLAAGLLAALLSARGTGEGQVVETSIAAGALALTPLFYGLTAAKRWGPERATNLLDGGAPFYRGYSCADGRHVAVGAIEPKFYRTLLTGLGLEGEIDPALQYDRAHWAGTAARFAATFKTADRDHWARRFDGTDACVTPVLEWSEAPAHPQHQALGSFASLDGVVQPAPQVNFSGSPAGLTSSAPKPGADTAAILARLGFDADVIGRLIPLVQPIHEPENAHLT